MFCELLPYNFFKLRDGGLIRYSKFSSKKKNLTQKKSLGALLVLPGAREFIEKKYLEILLFICYDAFVICFGIHNV